VADGSVAARTGVLFDGAGTASSTAPWRCVGARAPRRGSGVRRRSGDVDAASPADPTVGPTSAARPSHLDYGPPRGDPAADLAVAGDHLVGDHVRPRVPVAGPGRRPRARPPHGRRGARVQPPLLPRLRHGGVGAGAGAATTGAVPRQARDLGLPLDRLARALGRGGPRRPHLGHRPRRRLRRRRRRAELRGPRRRRARADHLDLVRAAAVPHRRGPDGAARRRPHRPRHRVGDAAVRRQGRRASERPSASP
jgi:hypothetical protein